MFSYSENDVVCFFVQGWLRGLMGCFKERVVPALQISNETTVQVCNQPRADILPRHVSAAIKTEP